MSELRIYIVFRADLPEMTRAKGEVQAAHAAASLVYENMVFSGAERLREYMMAGNDVWAPDGLVSSGQAKIVMEVDDDDHLGLLRARADKRGIPNILIQDEGRTVFDGPTITCLAFGPCTKTDGNAITRGARMRA